MNNVYQQLNSDRKLALLFGCLLLFLGSHWFHNAVAFEKTSNLKKEGEIRSFCQGDLKLNIEKILSTKNLQRSQWGILVKNLNNGEILYD
ncbi:MAG: D-alanyl-D-alanine carboxypeptidase/D-alanyl-D-alanine-endopeptidase, partial [Cyanobacteria bacterium P01_G01_bin.49]